MPVRTSSQASSKTKPNSKTSTSAASRTSSTNSKKPAASSSLKARSLSNSSAKVNNTLSSKKDQNDVTSKNAVNASKNLKDKLSVSSSKSSKHSSSKSKEEKVSSKTNAIKSAADASKGSSSKRTESSKKGDKITDKSDSKLKLENSKRKSIAQEKDSSRSKLSSSKSSLKSSSRTEGKEHKSKKNEEKGYKNKKNDEKEHKNKESKSKKKDDGNKIIDDNIIDKSFLIYKDEISTNAKVAEYGINEKETELQKPEHNSELKIESSTEDHQITNVNPSHNSLETVESGISITSPNDLSDGEVEESISSRFVEVDEMEGLGDDVEYSSPPSSSTNLLQSTASLPMSIDSRADDEEYLNQKTQEDEDLNQRTQKDEDLNQKTKEDEDYMNYDDDFENYESDFDDDDDGDDDADHGDEEGSDDADSKDDDEDESEDEDSEDSDVDDDDVEPDPKMKAILQAIHDENNRPRVTPAASLPETSAQEIRQIQQENGASNAKAKPPRPKTSKVYVNFNRAKERAKGEKASEKIKNRGQLLQEMIQLDTIAIDLFIQISDSYESYIAAFGRSNTIQASMQTNEDALSEGIQTDPSTMLEKWTQKPIHISLNPDSLPTPEDYLGVGGDTVAEEESGYDAYKAISSDTGRLTKFLSAASQVILMLLEEDSMLSEESMLNADIDENLGFSKSGIALGSGLTSLLEGRKSTFVSFCSSDSVLVLTGHGFHDPNNNVAAYTTQAKEDNPAEANDDNLNSSLSDNGALLCVWSVNQPSFPQRILTCRSPPGVACFNPGRPIVALAGLDDGSLAAWDFRESLASHPVTVTIADRKWRLSPPSFITACSREGTYEGSAIVALETVGRPEEYSLNFGSFQVVSLSALGQITWWVLVQGEIQSTKFTDISNPGVSTELGAAPWSRITMSRAATISIDDVLHSEEAVTGSNLCYDLKLSGNDANQLFVATANGSVVHCSRHNMKMHPSLFTPEIEPGAEAVSISICPHEPLYFLVGGNDGLIRLHSVTSSSPLTCWQASNNPAPVQKVEWSPSRPCVFYMLDSVGMFHIWDLSAGDIYPIISIEDGGLMGGQLINFNLANVGREGNQALYAVFASESGTVGIRSISSQFLRSSEEEYKNELERFKCYVSII